MTLVIIILALLAAIGLIASYLVTNPSTLALRKPCIVILLGCLIAYLWILSGIGK